MNMFSSTLTIHMIFQARPIQIHLYIYIYKVMMKRLSRLYGPHVWRLLSGTTVTMVLHFVNEQRLVCANLGDSRAVLFHFRDDLDNINYDHHDGDENMDKADETSTAPTMMPTTRLSAWPLTTDHVPNEIQERRRIESSGGT
jgi:serine/threonine protein phosphatase PrpC